MSEESKEKFLLGAYEIAPEGLGGLKRNGFLQRVLSSLTKRFSILAAVFQGISPDLSFCPASQSREPRSMMRSQKGRPRRLSRSVAGAHVPSDFLDLRDDMGNAGLLVYSDTVIGCIPIAHQRPVKSSPKMVFATRQTDVGRYERRRDSHYLRTIHSVPRHHRAMRFHRHGARRRP